MDWCMFGDGLCSFYTQMYDFYTDFVQFLNSKKGFSESVERKIESCTFTPSPHHPRPLFITLPATITMKITKKPCTPKPALRADSRIPLFLSLSEGRNFFTAALYTKPHSQKPQESTLTCTTS